MPGDVLLNLAATCEQMGLYRPGITLHTDVIGGELPQRQVSALVRDDAQNLRSTG